MSPLHYNFRIVQCFIDSIKLLDINGEVKQGVQEFLGLKFAQTFFSRLLIKRESTWKKLRDYLGIKRGSLQVQERILAAQKCFYLDDIKQAVIETLQEQHELDGHLYGEAF